MTLATSDNITIINEGINGNRIHDILERTPDVLKNYEPVAVILFWDSDCSDVDESTMRKEEVAELRANYTMNLIAVVTQILGTGSLLAISGPEVLGEGLREVKTPMLDDYREMNKKVAADYQLPYIDMRKAFLDDCPDKWIQDGGFDTTDGEHPNDRGTTIEAGLFAKQIQDWLDGPLKHD